MAEIWTDKQLEAITQKDCNLLVAAAAGAGKTAVLVERIIRKITDEEKPVDIDRLLVVTFTNAAATEMRERIGNALADALEANPSSANLQKQMALLDRASIMTLHSFCLEVVRNNFHILNLEPAFRIADETESMLMKSETIEALFEEKYENEDTDSEFFKLIESYCGGSDDNALREMVLALHRFTQSHPWPGLWLASQAEAYDLDASACLSSTPWARVLLKGAAAELGGLTALLEKAAAQASRAQGLEPYCGVVEEDIRKLGELRRLCEETCIDASAEAPYNAARQPAGPSDQARPDGTPADWIQPGRTGAASASSDNAASADMRWDALHAAFSSFTPARLPRCGKNADAAAQEEVKAARNQMKERLKKLYESGFDATAADLKNDLLKLYPQIKFLSEMVGEFDAMYAQKKRDKGLLDFNDLEHFCLSALIKDGEPTATANELSGRYEEILVDEYQDSNLVQELILETVSGNRNGRHNIFMVGDVKQSIYRFRQARPELFMSKYATYPRESGYDRRVIQLYKNFRSRADVINGVNFIFRQIMSVTVGELDYTPDEYLNPGAVYEEPQTPCTTGGAIEVHIIDVASGEDEIAAGNGKATVGFEGMEAVGSGSSVGSAGKNSDNAGYGGGNDAGDGEGTDGFDDEESLDKIQSEARIVGRRIKSLISGRADGFNIYDRKLKKYRPADYKDVVILMRATKNWADVFSDELAAMGIPAYADTGMGYFGTIEVNTMLSLLQIIDNPLQDIPMLAVLRSPIGGFSTDELADIRLIDRSASIYDAMKLLSTAPAGGTVTGATPAGGNAANTTGGDSTNAADKVSTDPAGKGSTDNEGRTSAEAVGKVTADAAQNSHSAAKDVRRKTAEFLDRLSVWRDMSQYMPTDELVWHLLTETGYYSYAGILPGGRERQANLRILFERARQYEEISYRGLFNFISFVNKLKSGGGDMGSAKILGESDNVVRIMSIHKSKGLEFPVVILAGCGKRFNMLDLNSAILLHQELGFGPDMADLDRRAVMPSMPKLAIRRKMRLETLSEEMRILYVAFTRAREKLIITGSVRNIEKACARWCAVADTNDERIPAYSIMQASNYLDWIGPAIARHSDGGPVRRYYSYSDAIGAKDGGFGDVIACGIVLEDISRWAVKLWGTGAVSMKKAASVAQQNIRQWLGKECDSPDEQRKQRSHEYSHLIKMLEWQYPYKKLAAIPAKISVTELKRKFLSEEQPESVVPFIGPVIARPLFMEPAKGMSAALKGTVMHFVMQSIDLKRLAAIERAGGHDAAAKLVADIKSQLESMTADERLTPEEADTVRPEAVAAFFGTAVGQRILAADVVNRETAFNIEIKCADIYWELSDGLYSNETMLLQGVIDCWFDTGNGLLLLDYKTDYVPDGGADLIKERYKIQLSYYTRALETITAKKVTERYLYLFHTGELLIC